MSGDRGRSASSTIGGVDVKIVSKRAGARLGDRASRLRSRAAGCARSVVLAVGILSALLVLAEAIAIVLELRGERPW